jgi:hypothetical protein
MHARKQAVTTRLKFQMVRNRNHGFKRMLTRMKSGGRGEGNSRVGCLHENVLLLRYKIVRRPSRWGNASAGGQKRARGAAGVSAPSIVAISTPSS